MIVISGKAQIRPDKLEQAKANAIAMSKASVEEPGCISYEFSQQLDDPTTFRLFEEWESAEALAIHFTLPHFLAFSGTLGDFLAAPPKFTKYEVSKAGPLRG
jgi:quinol monooxygenase YgiN